MQVRPFTYICKFTIYILKDNETSFPAHCSVAWMLGGCTLQAQLHLTTWPGQSVLLNSSYDLSTVRHAALHSLQNTVFAIHCKQRNSSRQQLLSIQSQSRTLVLIFTIYPITPRTSLWKCSLTWSNEHSGSRVQHKAAAVWWGTE